MLGIFIFRRDLRKQDNISFINSIKQCSKVLPIFILDSYQVDKNSKNNKYISDNSIQFMFDCLEDLNKSLDNKLHIFYGKPIDILKKIKKQYNFKVLGFNRDYSYYSNKRDNEIEEYSKDNSIKLITYDHDNVIVDYNKALTANDDPYTVFSGYYKKANKLKANEPDSYKIDTNNLYKKKLNNEITINNAKKEILNKNNNKLITGGRNYAMGIIRNIENWSEYNKNRDYLNYETTRLSAYLKYGCVSIREVYEIFKNRLPKNTELIKQLYWRSHYFVLARYSNNQYNYNHIENRFKNIKWDNSYGKKLWKGETGFPIIDAGVREMNETGFMHNRARLLVANFSIKILHINPFGNYWSGQEYFSRTLIDCCYANNYGNWLWILGPYDPSGYRYGKKNTFSGRIFKDIINFKKWDKDLSYVRKWIPELKSVSDEDVFKWNTTYKKYPKIKYKPIVDFDKRIEKWYKLTKK